MEHQMARKHMNDHDRAEERTSTKAGELVPSRRKSDPPESDADARCQTGDSQTERNLPDPRVIIIVILLYIPARDRQAGSPSPRPLPSRSHPIPYGHPSTSIPTSRSSCLMRFAGKPPEPASPANAVAATTAASRSSPSLSL